MNFKKYHVSRNLWDFEQWLADRGVTYTKDGNSYTFASQQAMYSAPFYFSQTDITISISGLIEAVTATNPRLHLLKADGTRAKTDALTTAVSKRENVSCAGLIFDWSIPGDIKVSLPMLNEGSTPLPYEPYSSEVWHDTPHYIHKTDTDTITTLPADIFPNAATATVGLKGNAQQNGTPTPDNPIMPQGTGERTGNLFDKDKQAGNIYVTESIQRYGVEISVEAGIYTVVGGTTTLFVKAKYGTTYETALDTSTKRIITLPQNGYILIYAGKTGDYDVSNIMLNAGSTPLPYEPYGYKLDIKSANTTMPVYLGEVETTRRIKKLVLTGEEVWQFFSDSLGSWQFYINNISLGGVAQSSCASNIAPYGATATTRQRYDYGCYLVTSGNGVAFQMKGAKDAFTDITAWKAYLAQQYAAGTPVTVWYVLATPETAVVNEPLRKIGEYADEVSGISIPVTAGGDTISVDTTLPPSEVTVNYKGWHPAIVQECTNGAWT